MRRARHKRASGSARASRRRAPLLAPALTHPSSSFPRLVWTLVHSTWASDARRGRELAEALAADPAADPRAARDLLYLQAVAAHKLGDNVGARRLLAGLLADSPHCRQALALKAAADDAVVRDGLVGLGVGAALLAGAAFLIAGVARRA